MIIDTTEVVDFLGLESAPIADMALLITLQPYVEQAIKTFVGFEIEQKTRTELLPRVGMREMDLSNLTSWDVVGGRAVAFFTGNRTITTSHTPVRSIVSLYEDRMAFAGDAPSAFAADTQLIQGTHFYVDWDEQGISRSGELIRLGSWPGIPRTVKVTYVTGYSRDELDGAPDAAINKSNIKLAVIKQMVHEFNEFKRLQPGRTQAGGLIKSKTLGDWSITYENSPATLPGTIDLLPSVKQLLAGEANLAAFL